jgi:MraZ protein
MDDCLFMFPEMKWEDLNKTLEDLPLGAEESRDFQRYFFGQTQLVEVDGSGRILIPEMLKQAANLNREVVFVGSGTRVEIWDAGCWNTRMQKIRGAYAKIAKDLI